MNIGLLLCDHVDANLILQHGDYPEMFSRLMHLARADLQVQVFDATAGVLPDRVDACDAYIISGSRFGVNDGFPWIAKLETFIHQLWQSQQKLIGICFGHQLIAKALGGTVKASPNGWGIGLSSNRIVQAKSWMQPERRQFNLAMSHQDQVLALPDNAQILADSDHCPYYMLQFGDSILTIQGHPEFSKAYSQSLINKRREQFEPERYEKGIKSLSLDMHNDLIAHWIYAFINQR